MTRFIYACYNTKYKENTIRTIVARSFEDAYEKIIHQFFQQYDCLESDDWTSFCEELKQKLGITISNVYDIEAL